MQRPKAPQLPMQLRVLLAVLMVAAVGRVAGGVLDLHRDGRLEGPTGAFGGGSTAEASGQADPGTGAAPGAPPQAELPQDQPDAAAPQGEPGAQQPDPQLNGDAPPSPPQDAVQAQTASSLAPGAACPGCDVVVVSLCSLRKDHVGVYGLVQPSLTPTMDGLARGGWFFDRAYAAGNSSVSGLSALLTGRFGSSTGVLSSDAVLPASVPSLPELMAGVGYSTAAFAANVPASIQADNGLNRGFQHIELSDERGTGSITAPAVRWLAEQPQHAPVFLTLHTRSAHYPYVVEAPARGTDSTGLAELLWSGSDSDEVQQRIERSGLAMRSALEGQYKLAVARADADVAALVEAQRARGRMQQTIWLLVGDHGESLGQHSELTHGQGYHEPVINIPLLLRVPGMGGQGFLRSLVSQVDVLPTLMDLVGAPTPDAVDGQSMLPLLSGEVATIRDLTLAEGSPGRVGPGGPAGAVIAPPWSLLRQDAGCSGQDAAREDCLYNLVMDPGQSSVVTARHPDLILSLLGAWQQFREPQSGANRTLELDPALAKSLRIAAETPPRGRP